MKTKNAAHSPPKRRASGRKVRSCESLLKAVFQRLPQKSASEVANRGRRIIDAASMPVLR
jgi:hypothetical protein